MTTIARPELEGLERYKFGWADSDAAGASARRGLNEEVVRDISALKDEPEWMLDLRLKGLKLFRRKPMPTWGSDLSGIDFENIKYFVRSTEKQAASWDDLPADIKNTYDRLGIPEAEKQRLIAGVAAQYESEVVYHKIREDLEEKGVIFEDTDTALRQHPELFREYFATVIPVGDNKFASLNTAVWSGGSFIYVPKGVHVEIPLQAYFRINTENMGQFERTLIIVDEDASVHYVEGCTAPIYSSDSLHSAVVEIIVKKGARCRYTTIQNWSANVYNLVTKRAVAQEGATMEWIDGNIGSKVTMKYPAVYLMGEHARGETLSVAFAGTGQHQDAGAKMVHCAPNTSSQIVSKSVARAGGRTSYRGPGPGPGGRRALQVHGQVRRAAGGHGQPLRHLPLRGRPRGRRGDGPRGDRVEDLRGPAVLPDEPGHDRGRGDGHDRPRVRRADRPRAADGVRARAEPADRAADGRSGRLMSSALQGAVESGAPVSRLHERQSYDPADFGVPTGREEEWRFTPLRRLRGLHDDGELAAGQGQRGSRCRPGVAVELAQHGDPRLGTAFVPADRVSARAFASFDEATVVTVPTEGRTARRRRGSRSGGRTLPGRRSGTSWSSVKPNARGVVVLDYAGSATYADNVELVVGDGAALSVGQLQDWADDAVHLSHHHAQLGKDAKLTHTAVTLGGSLVRLAPSVRYAGPGGDAELRGLYFADAGQHLEHRLFVDHAERNCRSRVSYKGALQGEDAHAVWIGDVIIRAAATGTDTYEYNRNLVLTDGTRVDSVPNLEILTGEVVGAGHASASGRLEDQHLFYLMARGIPYDDARRLVIRGFFGELIDQIEVPELRERVTVAIEPSWPGRWSVPHEHARHLRAGLRPRRRSRGRGARRGGAGHAGRDHPDRRGDLRAARRVLARGGAAVRGRGLRPHGGVLAARVLLRPAHRRAHRAAGHQAGSHLPSAYRWR